MRFDTLAIHFAQEPDPTTGAITTPICQTSTFAQKAPGSHQGFDYSRTNNPTRQTLTRNLCPYPQRMAYTGAGDVLRAENFGCKGPSIYGRR